MAQEGFKMAQESPKKVPRGPQHGPKMAPRVPKMAHNGFKKPLRQTKVATGEDANPT